MDFIKVELAERQKLTSNTDSFLFRIDKGHYFSYKAGQFVMLKAQIDGEMVERAYSIASPPPRGPDHAEYIELIIKRVFGGKLTSYLFSLPLHSSIDLAGPFGKMILREPIKRGDIFMATGTGIAPFMSMLRKVFRDHNPKEFYLFFGARTRQDIICEDELRQWKSKHKNFHLVICLSSPDDSWKGETGYVQDALTAHIKDFKEKQAYLCGIPIMVEQSRARLIELGMNKKNIYREEY